MNKRLNCQYAFFLRLELFSLINNAKKELIAEEAVYHWQIIICMFLMGATRILKLCCSTYKCIFLTNVATLKEKENRHTMVWDLLWRSTVTTENNVLVFNFSLYYLLTKQRSKHSFWINEWCLERVLLVKECFTKRDNTEVMQQQSLLSFQQL